MAESSKVPANATNGEGSSNNPRPDGIAVTVAELQAMSNAAREVAMRNPGPHSNRKEPPLHSRN